MADPAAGKLPLRHLAETPTFILMVILNFAILSVLIDFLSTVALIPPALRGTNWEATIRAGNRPATPNWPQTLTPAFG